MEIEAAVGYESESRYPNLQIGAEVTILGGRGPRCRSTLSR
jgi:hypothetical protein